MISHKMLGLLMVIIGLGLVVSGTIMFLLEPSQEPSNNSYCGLSYCMVAKPPIYCCKTLHGILFDTGWLIAIAGTVIMLFYRKEKLLQ